MADDAAPGAHASNRYYYAQTGDPRVGVRVCTLIIVSATRYYVGVVVALPAGCVDFILVFCLGIRPLTRGNAGDCEPSTVHCSFSQRTDIDEPRCTMRQFFPLFLDLVFVLFYQAQ